MNPNILLIRTPEGIEFSLPLAGPFSRMLAFLVDLAVIATAGSILGTLLRPLALFGEDFQGALSVIVYFATYLLYGILTEWFWRGQTLGKRVLRLRVVDAAGFRLEPGQVIVRNVLRFADALPALHLLGGVVCVCSRHRQRLGDLAAGTVVVRVPKLNRLNLEQILGGKYNSLAEQRHLAARLRQKVTPEVANIALECLLRRDELNPAARLALFAELAGYLRPLVVYPPEIVEQLADEQYVRNVVEVVFTPKT